MLITVPDSYFNEIFQQNQIKFAWCTPKDKDYQQLHGWVLYRDFLGDAVCSFKHKQNINIYGFKWDNTVDPGIDNPHIALKLTQEQTTKFTDNLWYLRMVEKSNGFKQTKITYQDKDHLVLSFSKQWLKKLWGISLYTYLVKCLCLSLDFDKLTGKELEYWNSTKHVLPKVTHNLKKLFNIKGPWTGAGANADIYYLHNYTGFVSQITKPNTVYYHAFNKYK